MFKKGIVLGYIIFIEGIEVDKEKGRFDCKPPPPYLCEGCAILS